MHTHHHLGNGFDVWHGAAAWFWQIMMLNGGGAIGAAASEAQAICEARASIEELSLKAADVGTQPAVSLSHEHALITAATAGWCRCLAKLEHYLIRLEAVAA
jgi:hypothetical protein